MLTEAMDLKNGVLFQWPHRKVCLFFDIFRPGASGNIVRGVSHGCLLGLAGADKFRL